MAAQAVSAQLQALNRAIELGAGRVSPETLEDAEATVARSASRTSLSADHTVIGFFGATGSGKSSLFNAVVGQDIARTAVRRPTTSEALAAIWGREGSDAVLDWLQVGKRVFLDDESAATSEPLTPWAKAKNLLRHRAPGTTGGMILLDLPDFDSIELANREIVERMVKMVDVLVWVFDPQKYADAVIHQEFIAPLAAHGGVMLAVLNQADLLQEREVPTILGSLERQLSADGLTDRMLARPLAVSARTGDGIADLRNLLASVAEKKTAALARVQADLKTVTENLRSASGGSQEVQISKKDAEALDTDLFTAVAGDSIVKAAGESYKIRAASSTGMVATRWLLKFKADPLKRLNLHKDPETQELSRSSLPPLTKVQNASVNAAARSFGNRVSGGLEDPWKTSLLSAAMSGSDQLPGALEKAISSLDFRWARKRWWWSIINVLQWLALLCAVVGLGWLLSYTVAGFFQVQLPAAPTVQDINLPVPTALLILAVLLALLLALTSRGLNAMGRKGYERRIRRQLLQKVHGVAQPQVVEPAQGELDRQREYRQILDSIR